MDASLPPRDDKRAKSETTDEVIDLVTDVIETVADNTDVCEAVSCLDGIDVVPTDCDPGCV